LGDGAPALSGEAEGPGLVHCGEEITSVRGVPDSNHPLPTGRSSRKQR